MANSLKPLYEKKDRHGGRRMLYIGIGQNRGKRLENDVDALAYALAAHGVEPVETIAEIGEEFRRMLLEWEFSGDWLRYRNEEEYLIQSGEEKAWPF